MKKLLLSVVLWLWFGGPLTQSTQAQPITLCNLNISSALQTHNSMEAEYDIVALLENGVTLRLMQNEIGTGTLMYAKSIVINGKWDTNNLLLLRLSLKSDGVTSTHNNYLESIDMSKAAFDGYFVMADYIFYNCKALKTVILPDNNFDDVISLTSSFFGCSELLTVDNFDKLTNILSLANTFLRCTNLQVIHFAVNPNLMSDDNIKDTFGETNPLKYLPAGVTDIPSLWLNNGYTNFVLPFTITASYEPRPVAHGSTINMPNYPAISPQYAAVKDYTWEYSQLGDFSDVVEYNNQILYMSDTNAKIRCTMTDQLDTQNIHVSDPVSVTVIPKQLTANGVEVEIEKEYDGTSTAIVAKQGNVLGVLDNESVNLITKAKFNDEKVGIYKKILVTYSIEGTHAENYYPPKSYIYTEDGVIKEATGMNSQSAVESISIYPNPVEDILNIQVTDDLIGKSVRIFHLNGTTILTAEVIKTTTSINLSTLQNGNYLLQIDNQILKLIKK